MTVTESSSRAVVVPPGDGPLYVVLGDQNRCLLSADQTGGAFSLFFSTIPPDCGPPPHTHGEESETFYVLSGSFQFLDADRFVTAGPGTCVHIPKGHLHTFKNTGNTAGTLLVIVAPGGFERFFAEMDALPARPPDMARILEIAGRHQVIFAKPRHSE